MNGEYKIVLVKDNYEKTLGTFETKSEAEKFGREIAKKPAIQKIMVNMIEDGHTKEEVEKWLYMVAIGSLCGRTNA